MMNKTDYVQEVERQLKNEKYYTKIDNDPSNEIKQTIQFNSIQTLYFLQYRRFVNIHYIIQTIQ